jgi:hypothetical protein
MDKFEDPVKEPKKVPVVEKKLYLELLKPMKVVVRGVGTILADGTVLDLDNKVVAGAKNILGPVSPAIAAGFVTAKNWRVVEK